jgi:hypothetical protein
MIPFPLRFLEIDRAIRPSDGSFDGRRNGLVWRKRRGCPTGKRGEGFRRRSRGRINSERRGFLVTFVQSIEFLESRSEVLMSAGRRDRCKCRLLYTVLNTAASEHTATIRSTLVFGFRSQMVCRKGRKP